MKCLFLMGLIICGAGSAFALEVTCASPSGESLLFRSDLSGTVISYENDRGPEFTPIEDGPVPESSADFYQMAYEDLKDVLGGFEVKWQPSECHVNNSSFWLSSCGGESTLLPNPASGVQATAVYLSELTESGSSGEQSTYRFRLNFEKDGNTYFVPLAFPKEFCKVSTLKFL